LLTPPPSEEKVKDITWSHKVYIKETNELKQLPFYKNYRVQAAVLLILLIIILIIFR
jgi:SSS family solute:Na+ symporter